MYSLARALSGCLAVLFLAMAVPALGQTDAAADPHEQCRGLCARFYDHDTDKRTLCETSCSAARDCSQQCATRYPDDADRRARCTSHCARPRGG